jgi:23S rRNA (guanosine2251-2'-O)-methyltransferase
MQSSSNLPNVVLLDRITDPHNVGAILRSAEVFGASAVVGTKHHSAPETGALAKAASGALERQPYIRVRNLADTIQELKKMGFVALGLDATGRSDIADAAKLYIGRPIALVMGAEGPGLRPRTKEVVDELVRIKTVSSFGSLNVSNAAAVGLYSITAS